MARTIEQVTAEIDASIALDPTLVGLTSTSATALWRKFRYVVAVAIVALENLFDDHRAEVDSIVALEKPHTRRWYQQKALAFQYGSNLVEGEDYYNNSALTPDQVDAQKIVAQAAATEVGGFFTIKAAKEVSGELEPLATAEYTAFDAYIKEIKDAGVSLTILSTNADKLKLTLDVYYDPTVLGSNGSRLDGTNTAPVSEAVKNYLRALPFDGLFVKSHLVDALQAVDGVAVPEIRSCSAAKYDNPAFSSVDVSWQPYSGFLRIYDTADLTINYVAWNV